MGRLRPSDDDGIEDDEGAENYLYFVGNDHAHELKNDHSATFELRKNDILKHTRFEGPRPLLGRLTITPTGTPRFTMGLGKGEMPVRACRHERKRKWQSG